MTVQSFYFKNARLFALRDGRTVMSSDRLDPTLPPFSCKTENCWRLGFKTPAPSSDLDFTPQAEGSFGFYEYEASFFSIILRTNWPGM